MTSTATRSSFNNLTVDVVITCVTESEITPERVEVKDSREMKIDMKKDCISLPTRIIVETWEHPREKSNDLPQNQIFSHRFYRSTETIIHYAPKLEKSIDNKYLDESKKSAKCVRGNVRRLKEFFENFIKDNEMNQNERRSLPIYPTKSSANPSSYLLNRRHSAPCKQLKPEILGKDVILPAVESSIKGEAKDAPMEIKDQVDQNKVDDNDNIAGPDESVIDKLNLLWEDNAFPPPAEI